MEHSAAPTAIRATDANWTDRRHHDRLVLRVAESGRLYQFDGWVRFGTEADGSAFNIIAGISRQDRETGRLTVFVETHAGRWKPIGHADLSDPAHLVFSLQSPQGESLSIRARILDTLSPDIRGRLRGQASLDDDEGARLDLEIQTPEERRSHFKVI